MRYILQNFSSTSQACACAHITKRACAVLDTPLFTPSNRCKNLGIFKISVKISEDFQDFTKVSGFLRDFQTSCAISRFLQRFLLNRTRFPQVADPSEAAYAGDGVHSGVAQPSKSFDGKREKRNASRLACGSVGSEFSLLSY